MILLVKHKHFLPEVKIYLFHCYVGTWTYTQLAALIERLLKSELLKDREMAEEMQKFLVSAQSHFQYPE